MEFDQNQTIMLTSSYNAIIQMWNTREQEWKIIAQYPASPQSSQQKYTINRLAIDYNKSKFAAACSDGVRIFCLTQSRIKLQDCVQEKENVTSIGYDAQSAWFYYTTEDGGVNIYDVRQKYKTQLVKQKMGINCAKLSPNQSTLVFGDEDGYCHLFDLQKQQSLRKLSLGRGVGVTALDISMDSQICLAGNHVGHLYQQQLKRGEGLGEAAKMSIHKDVVLNLAMTPDMSHVVSSSADKTMKVFRMIGQHVQKNGKQLYGHTE